MRSLRRFGLLLAVCIAPAMPAAAQTIVDCGDPPMQDPAIPEGESATRAQMLEAVEAVKSYSAAVDEYLQCMDKRAQTVFQWMTEEQRTRWNEDTTDLHNHRVEIQKSMNEAIRTFNASSAASGAEG